MTEDLPTVLLVEDDDVDAMLFSRQTSRRGWNARVERARNGVEALETLRSGSLGPRRIVLLDLNMPIMGGIEFLTELRSDPEIAGEVVICLTTSSHDRDVAAAFDLHVAGYAVKCVEARKHYGRLLDMIEAYFDAMLFRGQPRAH